MITIYTYLDTRDTVRGHKIISDYNEFFRENVWNRPVSFTDEVIALMKEIDSAEFISRDKIITPLGETDILHLSTNCKAAICVCLFRENIFDISKMRFDTCDRILQWDNINVHMKENCVWDIRQAGGQIMLCTELCDYTCHRDTDCSQMIHIYFKYIERTVPRTVEKCQVSDIIYLLEWFGPYVQCWEFNGRNKYGY